MKKITLTLLLITTLAIACDETVETKTCSRCPETIIDSCKKAANALVLTTRETADRVEIFNNCMAAAMPVCIYNQNLPPLCIYNQNLPPSDTKYTPAPLLEKEIEENP